MANLRQVARDPRAASAALERPAPPRDALPLLRRRLLDPGLDAQGVLALADAILVLQQTNERPVRH
jgi:hypothetical protein